jgi:hypothetical protein
MNISYAGRPHEGVAATVSVSERIAISTSSDSGQREASVVISLCDEGQRQRGSHFLKETFDVNAIT